MGKHAEELIETALESTAASLVAPGDWLTGAQRRSATLEALGARTNELDEQRRQAISPNAVDGAHPSTEHLSSEAVEVVHRLASDPGRLTRTWADEMIAALGEETYTELVGIAACTAVLDTFSWAMGDTDASFGPAVSGDPASERPDGVGDVGAWVAQSTGSGMANVSRSLSLVPVTNAAWVGIVQALYSRGAEFLDLQWDRALSRPQVELVAARTTAELECFYWTTAHTMLLGASGEKAGLTVDLEVATNPTMPGDAGVPAGEELLAFASAANRRSDSLPQARAALQAVVGHEGLVEAAATVAIFNGLVRVADGTGIQLDPSMLTATEDTRAALGIDLFSGAANSDGAPTEPRQDAAGVMGMFS